MNYYRITLQVGTREEYLAAAWGRKDAERQRRAYQRMYPNHCVRVRRAFPERMPLSCAWRIAGLTIISLFIWSLFL